MTALLARRGAIAASRAAGTPTTFTIYATVDGQISSNHTVYSTARAGANLALDNDATAATGQLLSGSTEFCYESFLSFDTSSVAGTITAVTLSLYGTFDGSTQNFVAEARVHDWGATLETADFVAGADLGTKTLVASRDTASGWAAAYNAFTSEVAFISAINQAGATRLVICSSRHRAGNTPLSDEYVVFSASEAASTTQDPKLVIEALV